MAARVSIAIVSIAMLAALGAACSDSDEPPAQLSPAQEKATARANVQIANTPTSFDARPASDDGAIWDAITARVSANTSPILRPPSPPEGFDTVKASISDAAFYIEYSAPNKLLRLMVGAVSNPPPSPVTGHSEPVMMRGIECGDFPKESCPNLRVSNDANPKERVSLIWYEPGREVISESETRDKVEYFITAAGVEPQFLIDFAKSLAAE